MLLNVLWPIVDIAVMFQLLPGLHLSKFTTAYVAVVPSANVLGFAGQEFARKMLKVAGILIETTFVSIAEILLFIVLILKHETSAPQQSGVENDRVPLIQAAILGSIFTNLLLCLVLVTLLLIFLVRGIEHVIQSAVPDRFLGLILPPLVEKAAEHLAAIDEAWAPSIHPALFNGLLVILVGWALGKPTDLNFEIFMIALLVLSILVVGNFLRDGESNLLEGTLLVVVYTIIAIACWCYPSPDVATSNGMDAINTTISIEVL
ncbi:calcium/proton exchanger [Colletotrichum nymphaeae SA-01]|uniref:Calcium/proton exchanger n=1 Tax=Colletotrichum nymphaeae SA-01 TaxID=1460502 RepID=A0A135U184_9PEZI|nr:calcium/proton exchanger [Colletotrichum nymphaeae SA-01]